MVVLVLQSHGVSRAETQRPIRLRHVVDDDSMPPAKPQRRARHGPSYARVWTPDEIRQVAGPHCQAESGQPCRSHLPAVGAQGHAARRKRRARTLMVGPHAGGAA